MPDPSPHQTTAQQDAVQSGSVPPAAAREAPAREAPAREAPPREAPARDVSAITLDEVLHVRHPDGHRWSPAGGRLAFIWHDGGEDHL
ncbi:MAG: hypothetical protein ACRDIC_21130, partial [bacterium]